jgi:hypothetical protein
MGNTLQNLPLRQPTQAQQIYSYLYGNAPIDPTAAAAQPVVTPDMTVNQPPAAKPSATYDQLFNGPASTAPAPNLSTPGAMSAVMNGRPLPQAQAEPTTLDNLFNQSSPPLSAAQRAGETAKAFPGAKPNYFNSDTQPAQTPNLNADDIDLLRHGLTPLRYSHREQLPFTEPSDISGMINAKIQEDRLLKLVPRTSLWGVGDQPPVAETEPNPFVAPGTPPPGVGRGTLAAAMQQGNASPVQGNPSLAAPMSVPATQPPTPLGVDGLVEQFHKDVLQPPTPAGLAPGQQTGPAVVTPGTAAIGAPLPGTEPPRNPEWDFLNQQYEPGGNAPVAGPPTPPVPLSTKEKILLGIGGVLNPVAGLATLEGLAARPRHYQERLQEYQRELPAVQEQANQTAYQHMGETTEALARGQEATASAGAQTAESALRQKQFEQMQHQMSFEQLQNLSQLYQSGKVSAETVMRIGQNYYTNNANLQAVYKPEEWNRQLQAVTSGQPSPVGMEIERGEGGVPVAIKFMGQRFDARNVVQAPISVQLAWDGENRGYQQNLAAEQRKTVLASTLAAANQEKLLGNREEVETRQKGREAAQKELSAWHEAVGENDLVHEYARRGGAGDAAADNALLYKAVGVNLPEGMHRMNQMEVNTVQQTGGLSDRAKAFLLKTSTGTSFPEDIRNEIVGVHDAYTHQKEVTHARNLGSLADVYGIQLSPQAAALAAKAAPSPASHVFNAAEWLKANPKGDMNAAIQQAQSQGFQIIR